MRERAILVLGLVVLGGLSAIGCGGSSGSGGFVAGPPPPLSVQVSPTSVAADGSSTATITVTARDTSGRAIPGEQITLQSSGSGNILVQPPLTDSTGTAKGSIASTVPESKTITAVGPLTSQTATTTVSFTPAANGTGVPTALSLVSGNTQSGLPGSTLPAPLVVRVVDRNGSGVGNVPVIFAVTTGGGTLTTTQTTTDSNGLAQSNLALGTTGGNNTVVVVARDFSGNNLNGSPVTFLETAAQ